MKIRFYKNGNRHLCFDKAFMLSINVTVSRLLGWCRNKEEFAKERHDALMRIKAKKSRIENLDKEDGEEEPELDNIDEIMRGKFKRPPQTRDEIMDTLHEAD